MTIGSFSVTVGDWCRNVRGAVEEVFQESAVEAVRLMQWIGPSTAYPQGKGGLNPVDTGWHTDSITVSQDAMPNIDPKSKPPPALGPGLGLHLKKWDGEKTYAQIRSAQIGRPIYIGYTAAYSEFLEFRSGPSSAFVRKTAQGWPMIVADAERKVKAKRGL